MDSDTVFTSVCPNPDKPENALRKEMPKVPKLPKMRKVNVFYLFYENRISR